MLGVIEFSRNTLKVPPLRLLSVAAIPVAVSGVVSGDVDEDIVEFVIAVFFEQAAKAAIESAAVPPIKNSRLVIDFLAVPFSPSVISCLLARDKFFTC